MTDHPAPPRTTAALGRGSGISLPLLITAAVAALVYGHFHDHFWYPPDDGAYAHVAERVLAGEVLQRDVQDLHLGSINFTNALALRLFGQRLVSLRYPLVAMGMLQALLICAMAHRSRWGWQAGLLLIALSTIQFLNPTAHWYCLFLTIVLVTWLDSTPRHVWWRAVVAGLLVGLIFGYRQLTGVLVGMGLVAAYLAEARHIVAARSAGSGAESNPTPLSQPVLIAASPLPASDAISTDAVSASRRGERDVLAGLPVPLLARLLCGVMAAGVLFQFARHADLWTLLVHVAPVLLVLAGIGLRTRCGNRAVVQFSLRVTAGFLLGLSPLVAYHLYHGSLADWWRDTIVVAQALPRMEFFDRVRFGGLLRDAVTIATQDRSPVTGAITLFWFVAVCLGPAVGFLLAGQLFGQARKSPTTAEDAAASSLPAIAVFYALVSLHFQIPIYLFYTAGLSGAGVLLLMGDRAVGRVRLGINVAIVLIAAIAIFYQAGQPTTRGWSGMVRGERRELVPLSDANIDQSTPGLDRIGLSIEPADWDQYAQLLDAINTSTTTDEAILALPGNPELYFLSGRRNLFPFYNAAFGLRSDADVAAARELIRRSRPALVFHRPEDKYNTPFVQSLVDLLADDYAPSPLRDGIRNYRLKSQGDGPSGEGDDGNDPRP
ncbi:MAG: hypothetical protein R3B90_02400 [Planctomycetaceae bacterium]